MKKWEYQHIPINRENFLETLDSLGKNGWEVCSVLWDERHCAKDQVLIKREILEPTEKPPTCGRCDIEMKYMCPNCGKIGSAAAIISSAPEPKREWVGIGG